MFQWISNHKKNSILVWMDFFLSAFYFITVFLSFIAPLPLLSAYHRVGRKWSLLFILSNALLVFWIAGFWMCFIYCIWIGLFSIVLSECLKKELPIDRSVFIAFLMIFGAAFLGITLYATSKGVSVLTEIQTQLKYFFDTVIQSFYSSLSLHRSYAMTPAEFSEWKSTEMLAFPSTIGILTLLLIVLNVGLLIRTESKHASFPKISFDFKTWKLSEYCVWPTLLSVFFLIFEFPYLSPIALNVFRLILTVYAIQGFSILSYFLNYYKITEIFRMFIYFMILMFMLPLVLCFGFFDLWFDFRKKLK